MSEHMFGTAANRDIEGTIAFPGRSRAVFETVRAKILAFGQKGALYPPVAQPLRRYAQDAVNFGIRFGHHGERTARLAIPEAVAVEYLHYEVALAARALFQPQGVYELANRLPG